MDSVYLAANEKFPVAIAFKLRDGISVPADYQTGVHLTQMVFKAVYNPMDPEEAPEYVEETSGNLSFLVKINAGTAIGHREEPTAIESIKQGNITVYPNPVNDLLTIEAVASGDKLSLVRVLDITGRQIAIQTNVALKDHRYQMNTASWQAGVYFIHILDKEGKQQTFKVVKL